MRCGLPLLSWIRSNSNSAAFRPISLHGCATAVSLGRNNPAHSQSSNATTAISSGTLIFSSLNAFITPSTIRLFAAMIAVGPPELISDAADKFGSQCVVVAIDAKRRADGSGWNIYKNGGRIDVGIDALEWAVRVEKLGAGEILLTSMDCDGTKAGYDLELTRAVADAVSIPVIASGGAGELRHFHEALTDGRADAALAASLFHYKELEIREVKEYLRGRDVPVRL